MDTDINTIIKGKGPEAVPVSTKLCGCCKFQRDEIISTD
jgi:hypothetical protein